MANVDKGKLQKLLALDLPQVAVANALGCTEGYIAQCMADASFKAEVAAMKCARLTDGSDRDDKLDKLEGTLIDKLEKSVAMMFKPREILDAFKVVNAAKRSNQMAAGSADPMLGQQARIVLPRVMAVTFVQNNYGEIVEAGGRSLATLPGNVLQQMATTKLKQLTEVPNGQTNIEAAFGRVEEYTTLKATAVR